MSSFWWIDPVWTSATCSCCGSKIWPEGDPDWGMCYECFSLYLQIEEEELAKVLRARGWTEAGIQELIIESRANPNSATRVMAMTAQACHEGWELFKSKRNTGGNNP